MEHFPKVTIVVPVYNYEQYIVECIDSCLSQTYNNIEVIVVDDGSTDNTPIILKGYSNKIRYIRQDNSGPAVALNRGVNAATGEYIAWLSSDDVFLPNKIEKQVALFKLLPDADLIYTDYYIIDSAGEIVNEVETEWYPPRKMLEAFIRNNVFNGSTVLMRKSVWENIGGFEERIVAVVDTYMWINLLLKRYKCIILPEKLVKYRMHSANQSSNVPLMRLYEDIVYTWAAKVTPVDRYYVSPKKFKKLRLSFYLSMNAIFSQLRFKRYNAFLSTLNLIPRFNILRMALIPIKLYVRIVHGKYLREFNAKNPF